MRLKDTNCISSQSSFLLIINSQSEIVSAFITCVYCRVHLCVRQKLDLYLKYLESLRDASLGLSEKASSVYRLSLKKL